MSQVKSGKKPNVKSLKIEDFCYLSELNIPLPQLVLGIMVPNDSFGGDYPVRSYNFKPGRTWLNIAHQTAGLACHQKYIMGTLLAPSPLVAKHLSRFTAGYYNTNLGTFGVSLNELVEYREDLKLHFGADCNYSHKQLEEGFLPVDVEYLPKLTTDVLPVDKLDELIDFESGMERAMGCIGRWSLVILAENSD